MDKVFDENDIYLACKNAKNLKEQIKICSEINCCSTLDIINILKRHGMEVSGRMFNGGSHKKNIVDEVIEEAEAMIDISEDIPFPAPEKKFTPFKKAHCPQDLRDYAQNKLDNILGQIDLIKTELKGLEAAAAEYRVFLQEVD